MSWSGIFDEERFVQATSNPSKIIKIIRSVLTVLPPLALFGSITGLAIHHALSGRTLAYRFLRTVYMLLFVVVLLPETSFALLLFCAVAISAALTIAATANRSIFLRPNLYRVLLILLCSLWIWNVYTGQNGLKNLHDKLAGAMACGMWLYTNALCLWMKRCEHEFEKTEPYRLSFSLNSLLLASFAIALYLSMLFRLYAK